MSTSVPSVGGAAVAPTPAPASTASEGPAESKIKPIPPKAAPAEAAKPQAEAKPEGAEPVAKPPKTGRQVLPGVVVAGDDVPELPVRGPDGKFISHAEAEKLYAAELAGEDEGFIEEPAAKPEPKKPELPSTPPSGKVTFLGKEYDGIAAVEQMYRSLQGMHDPIAKKLATTEKERNFGYEAANAWEQEARKARAELEQLQAQIGGKGPAVAPSTGPATAQDELSLDTLVDGIDYDAFEMIAHDPQGGTRVAGKYLANQIFSTMLNQVIPALRAEIQKTMQPVNRFTADQQTANTVQGVINSVAQYQSLDGKPAFPELLDTETLVEIANVWRESGLPVEHAMTAQGLISAIGLYRLMKALPSGLPEPAPSPAPVEQAPGASALAEGGEGEHTGMGRMSREDAHLSPEARNIRKAFDETPLFDKTLGFAVNRRR